MKFAGIKPRLHIQRPPKAILSVLIYPYENKLNILIFVFKYQEHNLNGN